MKFTLAAPLGDITLGEFQTPDAIAQMSAALEAAGVDACYLTDHPAPSAQWLHSPGMGHDALDPFTAFAFVAAATTRLKLHTNIIVMPYRNPFLTAKCAATLQVLSGGRLILGCGAGYQKAEFEALGVDFHQRGKLFDEALDVIAQAWKGGQVAFEGMQFTAPENEPRPVPNPPPPIWIGGGSEKAIARAALRGDGWSPFFASGKMTKLNRETGVHSVEQLAEKVSALQEMRAAHGRDGPFDIAIGPRARLDYATTASAEQFCEALGALVEAGVTWLMVDPPHPSRQAYIENVQWFGEEVIGRVRG